MSEFFMQHEHRVACAALNKGQLSTRHRHCLCTPFLCVCCHVSPYPPFVGFGIVSQALERLAGATWSEDLLMPASFLPYKALTL
jgi:hypothetical protein